MEISLLGNPNGFPIEIAAMSLSKHKYVCTCYTYMI